MVASTPQFAPHLPAIRPAGGSNEGRPVYGERRGKDHCGLGMGWTSVVDVKDVMVLFFDVLSGTIRTRSHLMALNKNVYSRHL